MQGELAQTLNRRRERSEAEGSVFVSGASADSARDGQASSLDCSEAALEGNACQRPLGRLPAAGSSVSAKSEAGDRSTRMRKTELGEALTRRREMAEQEGAVFECQAQEVVTDAGWDVRKSPKSPRSPQIPSALTKMQEEAVTAADTAPRGASPQPGQLDTDLAAQSADVVATVTAKAPIGDAVESSCDIRNSPVSAAEGSPRSPGGAGPLVPGMSNLLSPEAFGPSSPMAVRKSSWLRGGADASPMANEALTASPMALGGVLASPMGHGVVLGSPVQTSPCVDSPMIRPPAPSPEHRLDTEKHEAFPARRCLETTLVKPTDLQARLSALSTTFWPRDAQINVDVASADNCSKDDAPPTAPASPVGSPRPADLVYSCQSLPDQPGQSSGLQRDEGFPSEGVAPQLPQFVQPNWTASAQHTEPHEVTTDRVAQNEEDNSLEEWLPSVASAFSVAAAMSAASISAVGSAVLGNIFAFEDERPDKFEQIPGNSDQRHLPASGQPTGHPFPMSRQGQDATLLSHGPFPQAQGTALQQRLEKATVEVESLRKKVEEALDSQHIHPTELNQIVRIAETLPEHFSLQVEELEQLGWPTETLRSMREAVMCLDNWQKCDEAAKRLISGSGSGQNEDGHFDARAVPDIMKAAVSALGELLMAWCRLGAVAKGPMHTVCGIDRQARGVVPLVSALVDQVLALFRKNPDVAVGRELEMLLKQGMHKPELQDLGASSILHHALWELGDCIETFTQQRSRHAQNAAPQPCLASPDSLWQAVMENSVPMVATIIQQGGLVSGKTRDPHGHSVFWDACAFRASDVALLLLRHFPPDRPHGVDLAETHQRNGNGLLHLLAANALTEQAEGLFCEVFGRMPEALKLHKSNRKQTFLHVAANYVNFRILRLAISDGLQASLAEADADDWTPMKLLEQHLATSNVAERPPPLRDLSSAKIPSWCPLAVMQPPAAGPEGRRPPLADLEVTVEDAGKGTVTLHAHCVILATGSSVWRERLRATGKPDQGTDPELHIDSGICNSADVVLMALRFLYTGSVAECAFSSDASLLFQLVRLCAICKLPSPLREWATNSMLNCLENAGDAELVSTLLVNATTLGLDTEARQFIARRLIRHASEFRSPAADQDPNPVHLPVSAFAGNSNNEPALDLALAEIEFAVGVKLETSLAQSQPAATMPVGSVYRRGWSPSQPKSIDDTLSRSYNWIPSQNFQQH